MSRQLERGVVGYWCPMLATTGLRLYDRSGRGNHGTLTNMDAASDWVTRKVRNTGGRVLDFDGTNDRVVVPNAAALNPSKGISLSAWFRVTSTTAGVQQAIARKGWTGGNSQYSIRVLGDKLSGFFFNQSGAIGLATGATSLATNIWYFGAVTYDLANVRTYLNGMLDATTAHTGDVAVASEPLQIGAGFDTNFNTATLFLGGQLAEIAIWNRPLTPGEIRTLYRIGPGWFGKRESRFPGYAEQAAATGFKAYWVRLQSQLIGGGV